MWEEPGAGTEFNNATSPFELRRYTELQSELGPPQIQAVKGL